ncbi:MAG: helix-turn-helix domain-containing protein [Candidatus Sericytochromatia bacterium]
MTLLTPDVAALAAGVAPSTLRQWVRRGKLRRYGSRRLALYSLDELSDLVAGPG